MAKLDITKACEKGGQLLHNNQYYDVSMDDLHNLFKSGDYAKGLSKVFCLGFCQGYKAGQKTSIKKTTFVKSQKSNLPEINTTKELAKRINTGEQTASRIMINLD